MSRRRLIGAAALALAAVPVALGQQPAPAAGDPAPAWRRVLWRHGGPESTPEFLARLRADGYTAVSVVDGDDAGAVRAAELGFYSDQVVGKGVLELRDRQWQPVRDAYQRERRSGLLERPACLHDAAVRTALHSRLRARLAADLEHGPLAINLGDEVSVTRHAAPLDLCFAPPSLAAFRAALSRRFRADLDRLNDTWDTHFQSWDEVRPFTADEIRRRELGRGALPANLAPWAAHREFMDATLAEVVAGLAAEARELAPGVPVGLTGLQPPSAYGGHDYTRLLPQLDFWEAYDIGGARDLADCLARPRSSRWATVFPPARDDDPRLLRARLTDMLAHGHDGVVVWSAGLAYDRDGRPTAYGSALRAAFAELAPAAARFAGARIRRAPVWIVESPPSTRALWMIDSAGDGATWIRRLSSYEARNSSSLAARDSWLRLLEDLGLQGRLVAAEGLAAALGDAPPRVLVLPMTVAIDQRLVEAIRGYVEAGGTLLADGYCGYFDEHLRRRLLPACDRLFGIDRQMPGWRQLLVREGRPVDERAQRIGGDGPAVMVRDLEAELAEPVGDGLLVHVERRHGRGRAVLLNIAVCEYGRARVRPELHEIAYGLRERVRRVLAAAGVRPACLVRGEGLPTVIERLRLRAADGGELLAIRVNALDRPALLAELAERAPLRIDVIFAEPVALRDLLRGREHALATVHTLELDAYGGLFLEVGR